MGTDHPITQTRGRKAPITKGRRKRETKERLHTVFRHLGVIPPNGVPSATDLVTQWTTVSENNGYRAQTNTGMSCYPYQRTIMITWTF